MSNDLVDGSVALWKVHLKEEENAEKWSSQGISGICKEWEKLAGKSTFVGEQSSSKNQSTKVKIGL